MKLSVYCVPFISIFWSVLLECDCKLNKNCIWKGAFDTYSSRGLVLTILTIFALLLYVAVCVIEKILTSMESKVYSWCQSVELYSYNELYTPPHLRQSEYERLLAELGDEYDIDRQEEGGGQSRPSCTRKPEPDVGEDEPLHGPKPEARVVCYVCMDNEPVWAPVCGHVLCAGCIKILKGKPCPQCKQTIKPLVKIFM